MEPIVIILLTLLGLILQCILIIFSIRIATEKERKYQKIQTAIMVKMAKKAGVAEQEIDELFIKEQLRIL